MVSGLRFASVAALAACASMVAAPLGATEMPVIAPQTTVAPVGVFDADAVNVQNHRYWYRRNRVDAGDVIGAVVVLGTIAAVASAASRAGQRDRDYRYPTRERDYGYDRDYRSRPSTPRWDDSRGLDRAVDLCAREVERNARIESVEGANRTGSGWDVSGRLRTGESFHCSIGNDGRIEGVDYGRGEYRGSDAVGVGAPIEDRQWDDDRYRAARAAQDGESEYPGGPLPGESEPLTPAGDDGRYDTAQTPDFPG